MPWREEKGSQEQRENFVKEAFGGEKAFGQLCREYRISRKTGYKWRKRAVEEGKGALRDRRRGPQENSHYRIEANWILRILEQKKHPSWGSKKLYARLWRLHPGERLPSRISISRILKRYGLVRSRTKRRSKPGPQRPKPGRLEPVWCNDVLAVDFKGWFTTGDGRRCYPLTITDLYSRFIICCDDLPSMALALIWRSFERAFRRYGLPRAIRVDNGKPFGGGWVLGLSQLSVWWRLLGIEVDFIDPGKPYQNGSHERMHLTLKLEIANPAARNLKAQQRRTSKWVRSFNHERPHEALDMKSPDQIYVLSELKYHGVKALQYSPEFEVRLVNSKGDIQWLSHRRFIGEAFKGQYLGLRRYDEQAHAAPASALQFSSIEKLKMSPKLESQG